MRSAEFLTCMASNTVLLGISMSSQALTKAPGHARMWKMWKVCGSKFTVFLFHYFLMLQWQALSYTQLIEASATMIACKIAELFMFFTCQLNVDALYSATTCSRVSYALARSACVKRVSCIKRCWYVSVKLLWLQTAIANCYNTCLITYIYIQ